MPRQTKTILKYYFETGDKPTQKQFEDLIDSMVSDGFAFMGIAVLTPTPTDPGTPDQKMVYIAVEPGTYTNFGNLVVADGEVALLKYDSSWTKEATGIASQAKLTKLESEAIYDISAHNNNAVFESLQSLLSSSDLDSLIPASIRCGGMSIRFINSYNKYVQYRYTGIETTGNPSPFLDTANWRCTDITIISESTEVKASILPNELNKWGKIKSLTINSFQGAQEGCVNEYMLEFIVSGDDFTLTLPEGVRWVEEPTWENGYTYQVSIVNNLAVFAGWEAQTNE